MGLHAGDFYHPGPARQHQGSQVGTWGSLLHPWACTPRLGTNFPIELVDLIIAQRNYQSNAQTISVQDEVQQTVINLR